MNEEEQSVEERATDVFMRTMKGTPLALGIDTGVFEEEGKTDASNEEVLQMFFEVMGGLLQSVQLVAREVDDLKRLLGS